MRTDCVAQGTLTQCWVVACYGREIQRGDMCVLDSLYCVAEMNTTL